MRTAALRRLPGFAFEAQAPVHDEVLPRMDVAVFAGFAASGPINVPVPVEDAGQFRTIFGGDAPLAWDVALGRTVYAQLAPAVRGFFANGGRRCWVIRLAGAAVPNELPVPGVMVRDAEGRSAPLLLRARSAGSWSDGIAVATTLTAQRLGVLAWQAAERTLEIIAPADVAIQPGDLLRLAWRDAHVELYLAVRSAVPFDRERGGRGRTHWRVAGNTEAGGEAWFETAAVPDAQSGTAQLSQGSVSARIVLSADSPVSAVDATAVILDVDAATAPRPGEVVSARFGTRELLLAIESVTTESSHDSPSSARVVVRGTARWTRAALELAERPSVELLGLELWVRDEDARVARVGGLGMAPLHPRHVQQLPDDETVYGSESQDVRALWSDVVMPRLAVAGTARQQLCIPFGVRTLPNHFLAARARAESRLERDGLAAFDSALFTDAELVDSRTTTLLADTESMRFLRDRTREPTGVHAALAVEEATLIAVPDAVQPGWLQYTADAPSPPYESARDPDAHEDDDFADCAALLLAAPVLEASVGGAGNTISLEWTADNAAGPFLVQEATLRDWSDAAEAYAGPATAVALSFRAPGDYYYRVRGVGAQPTEWSAGVAVAVAPGGGWRVRRGDEYSDDVLVGVHRLLLRICAARRDVMAVLSLPAHYREDAALAHVGALASATAHASAPVQPLTGEQDALGFGALYHGWLHTRDDGVLRALTPDGAVCGVIARRALERGAWIPPANDLLRDVVALVQPAVPARWQELQQAQINVVRQQPAGFMVMSANTLARAADVRPINVRRLLILLRRVATRLGATYVFEPNDATLRRMVQRGFEQLLGDLFGRGAFAGRTAAQAFQVVTDSSINTRNSMDQGRFIVELRVAPSRPLVFITLRLVQTGERVRVVGA